MNKKIHWPSFFAGLGIAAVVVGLLHYFTGIGFWPLFAISTVAILVNLAISTTDEISPDR
jgi:cell division septal protein FtsQ